MRITGLLGLCATCVCVALQAPVAAAAATDIVLYASDAVTLRGNWSRATDGTAAGGSMLASVDRGWSNTAAPSASPADYVEFPFAAAAATPYHLWLRLRATANSKFNDAVFAQFSDAVTSTGAPLYKIGTTSGLLVNLATDASAKSLDGWGWQDGAYWLTQVTTASGTHTIRIQTREDGVQFDQIVMSPATYLAGAPGPATRDHTIVAKPAVPLSTPYFGSAVAIPGVVEVENFDAGGEGVAYHDDGPGNAGGQYRQTDVDIAAD